MKFPTWSELEYYYCTLRKVPSTLALPSSGGKWVLNPLYEEMATRRFNYASDNDESRLRLVFLKGVLCDATNKTLQRNGRFIWCSKMQYEGRDDEGYRQVSFTIDKGKKRFLVAEKNILCVPSQTYVSNNRYFRSKDQTFLPFSSVFGYKKAILMMHKRAWEGESIEDFTARLRRASPYQIGGLVIPRLGYFYPHSSHPELLPISKGAADHPCGIILGPSLGNVDYLGREFYRVRFGATTYERVHPIQMEIINEV